MRTSAFCDPVFWIFRKMVFSSSPYSLSMRTLALFRTEMLPSNARRNPFGP